jgi:medium-chain acyl-[acyl-carrier-protein] hydrolase
MNTWIMRKITPKNSHKCRLFCFPFAGGSASTYKDWEQGLPESVEVCPINLPGRGARFNEEAHSNMHTLTNALIEALSSEITLPYFFFGHSMGTMVAFELSRKLRLLGKELPRHIFLSARPGPAPFSIIITHTISQIVI